jgi:hypothetical protein
VQFTDPAATCYKHFEATRYCELFHLEFFNISSQAPTRFFSPFPGNLEVYKKFKFNVKSPHPSPI